MGLRLGLLPAFRLCSGRHSIGDPSSRFVLNPTDRLRRHFNAPWKIPRALQLINRGFAQLCYLDDIIESQYPGHRYIFNIAPNSSEIGRLSVFTVAQRLILKCYSAALRLFEKNGLFDYHDDEMSLLTSESYSYLQFELQR